MTRNCCGELALVDHDNDVFNWSANENPLLARNQEKCKSTRCFHLSNFTIAICSLVVLFSVVSLTIYFGLRQHMNGPKATWSNVMNNDRNNATASKVQLSFSVSHHSWHHNKLILRVWLGTCLAVGLFIAFTLLILVSSFLWKRHKKSLQKESAKLQNKDVDCEDMREIIEMRGSLPNETH